MALRRRFRKVEKGEQGFKVHIQTVSVLEKKCHLEEDNGEGEKQGPLKTYRKYEEDIGSKLDKLVAVAAS